MCLAGSRSRRRLVLGRSGRSRGGRRRECSVTRGAVAPRAVATGATSMHQEREQDQHDDDDRSEDFDPSRRARVRR